LAATGNTANDHASGANRAPKRSALLDWVAPDQHATMRNRGANGAAEVEPSFGRTVEGNAHAVEQVDDSGSGVAHGLDWRLIGQEVSTVDGVIKMLPGGVAFTLKIFSGIDTALGADGVRTLYRHDGEQRNVPAHLGNLDDCGKPGQAAADHYDFRV